MNAEQIRDSLQAAVKLPTDQVVLLNGDVVTVQGLTIGQRDQLEGAVAAIRSGKRGHFRALLVSWSLVDDRGHRVFSGNEALKEISSYPAQLLEPIIDKAMELSGITPQDVNAIASEEGEEDPAVEDFAPAEGTSSSSV